MVETSFSNGHFCKWNEGRPSGDHGHCRLTTSYSEGQGCFLSCCFCVVIMEIRFIKTNQNSDRGTRKAKSRCSQKPFFPSQGDWGSKDDTVVDTSKSAWKALRGCTAKGRVGTFMGQTMNSIAQSPLVYAFNPTPVCRRMWSVLVFTRGFLSLNLGADWPAQSEDAHPSGDH